MKARFVNELGLPSFDAQVLTSAKELAEYFEAAHQKYSNAKKLSNWIMTELMRELKGDGDAADNIASCKVSPENLASLLGMIEKGTISGKIAKTVFADMLESGGVPR